MNKLKEIRKSAGLTQQQLANKAKLARAAISHVETGRYPPTTKFAGKICRCLGNELQMKVQVWDVFPDNFAKQEFPCE